MLYQGARARVRACGAAEESLVKATCRAVKVGNSVSMLMEFGVSKLEFRQEPGSTSNSTGASTAWLRGRSGQTKPHSRLPTTAFVEPSTELMVRLANSGALPRTLTTRRSPLLRSSTLHLISAQQVADDGLRGAQHRVDGAVGKLRRAAAHIDHQALAALAQFDVALDVGLLAQRAVGKGD